MGMHNADWPMYPRNLLHTFRSPEKVPHDGSLLPSILWLNHVRLESSKLLYQKVYTIVLYVGDCAIPNRLLFLILIMHIEVQNMGFQL